jgi:radical SAM superfamily enzyme YgiQ (UPF0313 family)
MKIGLLTFPRLTNNFAAGRPTLLAQKLEPSVLFLSPSFGELIFLEDNNPRADIDLYLCSVYTRGLNEFISFSNQVGRDKVIAGGYHPTALPEEILPYAHKVVTGYCDNIDQIIDGPVGISKGSFGFTKMRRDLLDMSTMKQVYPDIYPDDICGSMVSSVGCPYDCDFCSTPSMSGRKMKTATLDYVAEEIDDLLKHKATTVFIRDESFATHPMMAEVAPLFKDKFKVLYSFGTSGVFAKRPELLPVLKESGWHSLNIGLEDVGVKYRKNINLKLGVENIRRNGLDHVMSFIVNDDGKTFEEAKANYYALYEAFADLKPLQVCANFLMPFPGTKIWETYKGRVTENDFDRFDSKTPLFTNGAFSEWHKRMLVAVQLKYYLSDNYNKHVRDFNCGDTLNLRMLELQKEFNLEDLAWDQLLEIDL